MINFVDVLSDVAVCPCNGFELGLPIQDREVT